VLRRYHRLVSRYALREKKATRYGVERLPESDPHYASVAMFAWKAFAEPQAALAAVMEERLIWWR